jgi:hypothetical protein
VALTTILAKFVTMGIFMATGAVIVLDSAELLEFFPFRRSYFMALCTFYVPVLARQTEFSVVVIEFGSRYKCFVGMAICTV